MPSEFITTVIVTVLDLLTTYLLHSTLLLAIATLAAWCCRKQSHALTERLWKSAAVIPLLTAPLQLLSGIGNPVFSPRWVEPAVQVVVEHSQTYAPKTSGIDESELTSDPLTATDEPLTADMDVAAIELPSSWLPAVESNNMLPIEGVAETPIEPMPSPDAVATDVAPMAPAIIASTAPPSIVTTVPALPKFAMWLAGLVVSIVTVGLLRFIVAGQRFRLRIRKFRAVETGVVCDSLAHVVRKTSVRRRVRLLEADDVGEPIAFGVWRWTIAVPRGIETRLNPRELEALLAHELAHLVRGDAWWLLIGRLLCCCLPFQPLNFLARMCWRQAAEFQCDDWAADRTGSPLSLAHCLTRVAEWRLNATSCAHALPAGGLQSTLSRRVERLLVDRRAADPWSHSRRRRLLTVFTLIVTAVLCWLGPRTTLLAQFDEQREGLTSDGAASFDIDAESLADEIDSLNAELRQLESDLRRIEFLMRNSDPPTEVRTLATHLSSRLADLRRHRRELLARAGPASNDD